jgi:hypothetical protein
MAVADNTLQIAQTKKEFWEALGTHFGLADDGSLVVTFMEALWHDENAKRECNTFVAENHRSLHALVLTDGDPVKMHRFESVMWERDRGRFMEELP